MQNRTRDTDVQKRLLDSVGEGEGGMFRENSIETSILSRVKQITSPGWMHEASAQGWCTGKTPHAAEQVIPAPQLLTCALEPRRGNC